MGLLKVVNGIRKALGKLTDLLNKGRQASFWSEKNTPKK